jgi:hypothetical protein
MDPYGTAIYEYATLDSPDDALDNYLKFLYFSLNPFMSGAG